MSDPNDLTAHIVEVPDTSIEALLSARGQMSVDADLKGGAR